MQGIGHIGMIMDGNRRFAKRLMRTPSMGHRWGAEKLAEVVQWCKDLNIRKITLYTLSLENFNRPKKEFDYLMELFKDGFDKIKDDERIPKFGIKVRVIGRTWMLPEEIQDRIRYITEKTKKNRNYTITFAMAYGGRQEIADAAREIAVQASEGKLEPKSIDENKLKDFLYMEDEPDLIIRTGGDHRTSNFLSFQSAYSEWFFVDKMWPEFEKEDLQEIIDRFNSRERRFGR